jgi:hypothetical protein
MTLTQCRCGAFHNSTTVKLCSLADLSSDDIAVLGVLRERMDPPLPWGNPQGYEMHLHNRMIALLDRLIAGAKP